jgi:hypothetical protein
LAANDYLAGHYQVSAAARLTRAEVRAASVDGLTVLELEVAGVLTGQRLVLAPSPFAVLWGVALSYPLAALAQVRWKVVSAPAASADQATGVALCLDWVQEVVATATEQAVALSVRWNYRSERLVLYDYATATRTFTERTAGVCASRATIVNGPNASVTFYGSAPVLNVTAAGLATAWLREQQVDQWLPIPRLEFVRADARGVEVVLAHLDSYGNLMSNQFTEAAPGTATGQFEWIGGSAVKAAFGLDGVVATDLTEV